MRELRILAVTVAFVALAVARQPASADDITVLVIDEAGSTTTPVPGATVTLRGTNPGSQGGLVQVTGAGGTATFAGVTGPYSVTAQKDFLFSGVTIRAAGSVVDIDPVTSGSPRSGTIGVLLEVPASPTLPSFATMTGTISNLPALSGTEIIEVVAVERGDLGVTYPTIAFMGSYFANIPAGKVFDVYVAHRTNIGQAPVLASLIATGLGPTGPGTVLVQNFDFASAVPWNQTVSVSESGREAGLTDVGIQLELRTAAGINIDFSIFDGTTLPATILLPDLSDPAFSGFARFVSADAYDPLGVFPAIQDRSFQLTSTPASLTFDFMPVATPVNPTSASVLSPAEIAALNVDFVEGTPPAGFGSNGINGFTLGTDPATGAPPGIDASSWLIIAEGGNQNFDMPPAALPMFSSGQTVFVGLVQQRLKGFAFTYEDFFDANLAANLAALNATATEEVGCDTYFELVTGSTTYCTAGTSASGCQAMLSTTGIPSASQPNGFLVNVSDIESNKNGILFFGANGRQANPWGNSTSYQCVVPPVKRTGLLVWPGPNGNCTGSVSKDMNAHWATKPAQNPGAGATVQTQFWYRDPVNTSNQTTSLSDAVEYTMNP